jgi:hypothetical protein
LNGYEWWGGTRAVRSLSFAAGKTYIVKTLTADFAEIEDDRGYGGWVPV